jgi:hypothetical protein
MADTPLKEMTLREMLADAEHLTRELIEHLDQNFIPRAHALRKLVRPIVGSSVNEEVEDISVRDMVIRTLKSEEFTEELYEKNSQYCAAIDDAVSRIKPEIP